MTVRCNACGQEWPRDPALEVESPECRAATGAHCRRPSGQHCAVHAARDRLAMQRVFFAPCPAGWKRDVADSLPLSAHCQPPEPVLHHFHQPHADRKPTHVSVDVDCRCYPVPALPEDAVRCG